jgi:uncharacterized protein with von Willebrand factor type A (vWA) domain
MGLRDLLGRAKSFLGKPKPTQADDAIWQHSFDKGSFDAMLPDVPVLTEAIEDLQNDYDYSHEMIRDVWAQFYQSDPRLRTQTEMDPRYLRNHAVAADIAGLPETPELRAKTQHDRYAASLATISLVDHIKEYLSKAGDDELDETQQAASTADQAAQDANGDAEAAGEAAGEAAAALDAAMGEFDGNGPLTESQSQAADTAQQAEGTLEDALAAAEAALAQSDAAGDAARQAAQQAQVDMRAKIRESVTETLADLEAEAELFAAWGIGRGEMQKMDFNERAQRALQFRNSRLAKFRQMIGRYRYEAAAMQSKKVDYGREEMVGIELSGDFSRLLESEVIDITSDVEEISLLAICRFVSSQSLSRKFIGTEKIGQGAIICCIDNSYSMTEEVDSVGITREACAKAMGLALLDDARANGRDFLAINFASKGEISVWKFPKGANDIDKVIEWTEEFFGGGTDFATPLAAATEILLEDFNTAGTVRADIVFITDDDCAVSSEFMKEYLALKEQLQFRVFGVMVGEEVHEGGFLDAISDHTRSALSFMDPTPHLTEILRVA